MQSASAMKIRTKAVPVEAHWSIGMVERYHIVLQLTYEIISQHIMGKKLDKKMLLQMDVKEINDSTGSEDLVPTLLVYGAFTKMSE